MRWLSYNRGRADRRMVLGLELEWLEKSDEANVALVAPKDCRQPPNIFLDAAQNRFTLAISQPSTSDFDSTMHNLPSLLFSEVRPSSIILSKLRPMQAH